MTNSLYRERVVSLVRAVLRPGPVVEVCCGSGWLTRSLPEAVGVDPEAPAEDGFHRQPFANFLEDRPETWREAQTVVLCYPPGPCGSQVGRDVVRALLPHHTLVLVSPRPFLQMTVAGTVEMWEELFRRTVLVSKRDVLPGCPSSVYALRPSSDAGDETRRDILGDHELWEPCPSWSSF